MTFTYVADDLGDKDAGGEYTLEAKRYQVRFHLGDTEEAGHFLEDEEIDFLISLWFPIKGSTYYAAAAAADTIAARYAQEASYSADGVSISLGPVADQFRALASALRLSHANSLVGGGPDVGGITPGEGPPPGVKHFDFGTEMHDNPEAGYQHYQPNRWRYAEEPE